MIDLRVKVMCLLACWHGMAWPVAWHELALCELALWLWEGVVCRDDCSNHLVSMTLANWSMLACL